MTQAAISVSSLPIRAASPITSSPPAHFSATGSRHASATCHKKALCLHSRCDASQCAGLVGGKINEPLIERNWPDILRIMATIAAGIVAPSQILRKLASYPRQNELALLFGKSAASSGRCS
jgi:TnpA family transposase